jgi:putative ABC transport system permease protein
LPLPVLLKEQGEVGLRKVLGALRTNLIMQFLAESFMLNFIALLIALVAAFFMTPAFNHFVGRVNLQDFSFLQIIFLLFYYCFYRQFSGRDISGICVIRDTSQ